MNRAVRKTVLFKSVADYKAFIRVVREALHRYEVKVISYQVMPNHWHFVIICDRIEEVSNWLHWITGTHAIRWNLAHECRGTGAVYQSRFKAVPVQTESSLLRVCRYVERNALRAGLVSRAELWTWGSLCADGENCYSIPLGRWPILRPQNWIEIVNGPEGELELIALRKTIRRNQPIGDPVWQKAVAPFIGLSMRPVGRPKKVPEN
jgi:putative transposase